MPKKINSRAKGVTGEHEVRDLFRARGYVAKRGQQHEGGSDSPDVISPVTRLHIEVKRTEAFHLYKAMEQANADRNMYEMPVVFHRKNKQKWVVILEAEDFFDMLEDYDCGRAE